MTTGGWISAASVFALLAIQTSIPVRSGDAAEASGLVRMGNELLIVCDSEPGAYYRLPLPSPPAPAFTIDPTALTRVKLRAADLALDLESIDVLADGRVVVLSERLRALVADEGLVVEYDDPLTELGERGLEGLAVRPLADGASRVAVLWEGGYPSTPNLPPQLRADIGGRALRPVVLVHDLPRGAVGLLHRMEAAQPGDIIQLQVPEPPGLEPQAQRFRAPDLVWHAIRDGEWGFIVLLNSMSGATPRFDYRWLQRFTLDGQRLGEPLDIDAHVPQALRELNWEGLAWYESGQSLLLIDDTSQKRGAGPATIAMIPLPRSWQRRGTY